MLLKPLCYATKPCPELCYFMTLKKVIKLGINESMLTLMLYRKQRCKIFISDITILYYCSIKVKVDQQWPKRIAVVS